jgi:hypothetical protein
MMMAMMEMMTPLCKQLRRREPPMTGHALVLRLKKRLPLPDPGDKNGFH